MARSLLLQKNINLQSIAGLSLASLLPLQGVRPVQIRGAALPSGNNILGTVPSGKRWFLRGSSIRITNPSVNSIDYYGAIETTGGITRISAATTTAGATRQVVGPNLIGPTASSLILNAGESFIVNTSESGLNIQAVVFEFNAAGAPFAGHRILSLGSGDNTLYTCPANTSAFFTVGAWIGTPAVWLYNGTGGAITYAMYLVPDGETVGDATLLDSTSVSAGATGTRTLATTLRGGDRIIINASSAGGVIWAVVNETPD